MATSDEPKGPPPAAAGPGAASAAGSWRNGRDPWAALASHTAARIALGRTGGSLRTESQLEFRLAHAGARDAVQAPFEIAALQGTLEGLGLATETLATAVADRATYLRRPDLGRVLDPASAELLRARAAAWGNRDLAILVSDGLSATAAGANAAATVAELARMVREAGWTLYPVFLVPFARVKLQDAVGQILQNRLSVILLGERPGLSAHDSLGAYLTFAPRSDRTDADRNCVSNIRTGGLPPAAAALRIAHLLFAARRQGASGLALREAPAQLDAGAAAVPGLPGRGGAAQP